MLEQEEKNYLIELRDYEEDPPFKSKPSFKDWIYRLVLFLIGFLGLEIVGILVQLILALANINYVISDSSVYIQGLMLINTTRYLFIFIVLIRFLFPRLKYLLSRFKNWKNILIGLGFGVMIVLLSEAYNRLIGNFVVIGDNVNESYAEKMVTQFPVISIIMLGIIGPIVEEITYRYGLFGCMRKKSKLLAYTVSVFVFALIHFNIDTNIVNELFNLPSYILSGILLTIAYDKFNLEASITAHVFNNMLAMVLVIIGL